MPTLVTGGTGLLGINVVRQLVARGEDVRLLVRPSKRPRIGVDGLDVERRRGDVTDVASVRAAMRGVTRVYHIAALTALGPWPSTRRQLEAVNVDGTRNVCEAALRAGVERLVYTSSTVAIGYGSKERPATERTRWNLGGMGPYYDTKKAAEDLVLRYVKKGLPAVITNPGFLVGPWDVKPTSGMLILQAARLPAGLPMYSMGGGNNVCDAEDVAEGHLLAMERGRIGERYILGNENLSYREFCALANAACGKPPPRVGLPPWALVAPAILLDAVGYFASELMDSYNSVTIRAGAVGHYVSPRKAVAELGLKRTPPIDSMQKALRWFREYGYLRS